MIQAEELLNTLQPLLPIRVGGAALTIGDNGANTAEENQGNLRVCLRLFIYERDGDDWMIRNIKEQMVCLIRVEHRQRDASLMAAYLEGWCLAISDLFTAADLDALETWMPYDLAFPRVFGLKRPKTAEDFRAAFHVKSRFGKAMRAP